ncbi:MAG: non-canonical purine NTP pyrophosphatase [Cenarchaeum sp. SB0661_bin_35]|nr:non-canonical purine NTP pyrophosphatase [Cenarchaeum sp. SB0667_bin_13]MYC79291.1 non-canonical purine NTP pyrophosphatase [Cenarchaeum sp. SB0661_bin_35]MYI51775.1 non-canonical purine NTP pyrophosphatase [Cenarchaeum sp. SB0673_bin_9]
MPGLSDVYFVSSNNHKFQEIYSILDELDITVKHYAATLPEIQSASLYDIATHKAAHAYTLLKSPVIVEDAGLFIDSLKGFPGPYSSFVYDTIGNQGILNLVKVERGATFRSIVAYSDGSVSKCFSGELRGAISTRIVGTKWGYDPIFMPDGSHDTLAHIDKVSLSHRRLSLESFAAWFVSK